MVTFKFLPAWHLLWANAVICSWHCTVAVGTKVSHKAFIKHRQHLLEVVHACLKTNKLKHRGNKNNGKLLQVWKLLGFLLSESNGVVTSYFSQYWYINGIITYIFHQYFILLLFSLANTCCVGIVNCWRRLQKKLQSGFSSVTCFELLRPIMPFY